MKNYPNNKELIPYRRYDKWGYCDKNINILIPLVYDEARPFQEERAAVRKGKLWGFIDLEGNIKVEIRYPSVFDYSNGFAFVIGQETMGKIKIDKNGKIIEAPANEDLEISGLHIKSILVGSRDNQESKFIYVDNSGNQILPAQKGHYFEWAKHFINGKALVNKNRFINREGEDCYKIKLKEATEFSEGYSAVIFDNVFGFVDINNNVIVPIKYDLINEYSDGLVYAERNGEKYFLDSYGNEVLNVGFDKCRNFVNSYCAVSNKNKWGFINKIGDIVIPIEYDEVNDFSEEIAFVGKNNKYGYITTNNTCLTGFIYNKLDWIIPSEMLGKKNISNFRNGVAIICVRTREDDDHQSFQNELIKFGYIDRRGDLITAIEYDLAFPFSGNLAVVGKYFYTPDPRFEESDSYNDEYLKMAQYGFINKNGEEVIKVQYEYVSAFRNGCAIVQALNKQGAIDSSGQLVLPIIFRKVEFLFDKLFKVVENDGLGWEYKLYDYNGNLISDRKYSNFREPSESMCGYSIYERKENNFGITKAGFMDKNGIEKIKPLYKEVNDFKEGLAAVLLCKEQDNIGPNEWAYISLDGTTVIKDSFLSGSDFCGGFAIVSKLIDGIKKSYYINTKGENIFNKYFSDDFELSFFSNGFAAVKKKYWGPTFYYDSLGNKYDVKPPTNVNEFGLSKISMNFVGYISENGANIILKEYEQTKNFNEGFAAVKKNGKWLFINNSFELAFGGKYNIRNFYGDNFTVDGFDEIKEFSEGRAAVKLNDIWGFINDKGELAIDLKFKHKSYLEEDFYKFKNGLAKILIEAEDEEILARQLINEELADDLSTIQRDEKVFIGFIDREGKEYFESIGQLIFRVYQNPYEEERYEHDIYKPLLKYFESGNPRFMKLLAKKQIAIFYKHYKLEDVENEALSFFRADLRKINKIYSNIKIIFSTLASVKTYFEINQIPQLCQQLSVSNQIENNLEVFQLYKKFSDTYTFIESSLPKVEEGILSLENYFGESISEKILFHKIKTEYLTDKLIVILDYLYERNLIPEIFELLGAFSDVKYNQLKLDESLYTNIISHHFQVHPIVDKLISLQNLFYKNDSYKSVLAYFSDSKQLEQKKSILHKYVQGLDLTDANRIAVRIAKLFIKKPYIFLEVLSKYFAFSEIDLDLFKEKLSWQLLSGNKNICFTKSLLKKYRTNWFWNELVTNESIIWDSELIKEHLNSLHRPDHILGNPLHTLSQSLHVQWNIDLISEFEECWDWDLLSNNDKIPWSVELLQRFKFRWNWSSLCMNGKFWTREFITDLENELDHDKKRWNYLLTNSHINWTMDLILFYKNRWFTDIPFRSMWDQNIYTNKALPWGKEFLELFKKDLNWYKLSTANLFPWSESMIKNFIDNWQWYQLCGNSYIDWDAQLISEFENRIIADSENMDELFNNVGVHWDEHLIELYTDRINWDKLSENTSMNWSSRIIEKFEDRFNWKKLFLNSSIDWDESLLNKYKQNFYKVYKYNQSSDELITLDKLFISQGNYEKINWSYDLIKKYCNEINWSILCQSEMVWSNEIIDDFNEHFVWENLANNKSFPWDLELVKRFSDKMLGKYEYDKYKSFFGDALDISLSHYEYLVRKFPEIELTTPSISQWYNIFHKYLGLELVNRIYEIVKINDEVPMFENEAQAAKSEAYYEMSEYEERNRENYTDKYELADILGYDDDDIDDISEDDIWERTGH